MSCQRSITYHLHKLVFIMEKIADKELKEKMGVTHSQFKILMAIDCHALSQREVAEYWNMTEAAVSRQVDSLVKEKYIKLKENPENRRCNTLTLSDAGKKTLEKGFTVIDQKYQEIYGQLTPEQATQFLSALEKMLCIACPSREKDTPFESCTKTDKTPEATKTNKNIIKK